MNFKNRNATKPNRVTITPENGTAFTATISRNDSPAYNQEGTMLTAEVFNQMCDDINASNSFVTGAESRLQTVESAINNLEVKTIVVDENTNPSASISSSTDNKFKTITFNLPKAKQGKSYRNMGEWVNTKSYVNDENFIDTVFLNGCTYFCKISNNNVQPVDNSDSQYWGLLARRGGEGSVTIVDNLNSTSSDAALSANQGNYIKQNYALKSGSVYKGTCQTAQSTTTKEVVCDGFVLETGATIDVEFVNASVSSAYLNVNSTGAKQIKYQSSSYGLSNISGSSYISVSFGAWSAGDTVRFIYNGTYWIEIFNVSRGVNVGKQNAYSADSATYATYVRTKYESPTASTKRYLTFVDSNNSSSLSEQLYTDDGISYDSYNNTLQVENLSDGTISKPVSEILSTTQLPIGAIFQSAVKLNDSAYHALDGSSYSQSGVYSEFVSWLKAQVSAGNVTTCSEDEFSNSVSNTGNCGKFVIDNNNNTFRFPKITRFVQGISSDSDIGNSIVAGIPNIVGGLEHTVSLEGTKPAIATGCFTWKEKECGDHYETKSGGNSYDPRFNANNGSAIKGIYRDDATTVQPQATQYPFYIVVANSVKTNIQTNIDNISSDISNINSKIDNKFCCDGIFIQNKTYYFNKNSSANIIVKIPEITSNLEVETFTINTNGRPLIVLGSVFGNFQKMHNAQIYISIDGVETELFDTCQEALHIFSFTRVLKGIDKGSHIVKFMLKGNNEGENQSFNIPQYTTNYFAIYEI